MLYRVKDLSPEQKHAAERLLGHPVSDDVAVSIKSLDPATIIPSRFSPEERIAALRALDVKMTTIRKFSYLAKPATIFLFRNTVYSFWSIWRFNVGGVVSKEQIINTIWKLLKPSERPQDNAVQQIISHLRDVLKDGTRTIIKTVPKRGYSLPDVVITELTSAQLEAEAQAAALANLRSGEQPKESGETFQCRRILGLEIS